MMKINRKWLLPIWVTLIDLFWLSLNEILMFSMNIDSFLSNATLHNFISLSTNIWQTFHYPVWERLVEITLLPLDMHSPKNVEWKLVIIYVFCLIYIFIVSFIVGYIMNLRKKRG